MPRVSYNGLIADVLDEHLEEGIAILSQESRNGRRQILASVERALDKALRRSHLGREAFSEQELRDIANDICLWFAGEVIAGRAERYKVEVQ